MRTLTYFLFAALITTACSKGKGKKDSPEAAAPEAEPVPEEQPETAEPAKDVAKLVPATAEVSEFLQTSPGTDQSVRKDEAQVLLTNDRGDVVLAGVTRSKITREPALGGDLFFTRYRMGEGWSDSPVQVPVDVPVSMLPPPNPENPSEKPKPLSSPLLAARGGRLLETGKALLVGELVGTFFSSAQLNLAETKDATRMVFFAAVGASENGMMKSVRYGLTGENTVVATATPKTDATFLMTGFTTSGLRKNGTGIVETETTTPSNYLAEVDAEGDIVRHLTWPVTSVTGVIDNVKAMTATSNTAFVAFERQDGAQVLVKGLRLPSGGTTFIDLPEKEVCAEASTGATKVRVASVDATETELVVAVEISNYAVSEGTVLPCFEIFEIKPQGTLISKREIVNLKELPTVQGTTRATIVQDGRILLTRSRENTDSRGQGEAIVTFLYERPLSRDGYQSRLWSLIRPKDWYGTDSVDGLKRRVQAVVWPKNATQQNAVWILSNDLTAKEGAVENLTQLGSYGAVPKKAK